jgi:sortase (surface protein transpeptidase)
MKITRYNVAKAKRYTDKDGNQKTSWSNVGIYTEFLKDDGSIGRQIEIPAIGLDCPIYPPKDATSSAPKTTTNGGTAQTAPNTGDVKPEDIPF